MRISQFIITIFICTVRCSPAINAKHHKPIKPAHLHSRKYVENNTLVYKNKFIRSSQNITSPVDSLDNILTPLVRMKREPPIIIHRIKKRRPKPPRRRPPKPKPVYGPPSSHRYPPLSHYTPQVLDNNFNHNEFPAGPYDGISLTSNSYQEPSNSFDNLAVGEFHDNLSPPSFPSQSFGEPPTSNDDFGHQDSYSGSNGNIGGFVSQGSIGGHQHYSIPPATNYGTPTQAGPPQNVYSAPSHNSYSPPPSAAPPPPPPPPQTVYSKPPQNTYSQPPPQTVYSHPLPQQPVYSQPPTNNYQAPSSFHPPAQSNKYSPPPSFGGDSNSHFDFGSLNHQQPASNPFETSFSPSKTQFAEPTPTFRPKPQPPSSQFPLEFDTLDLYKTPVSSYDVPLNFNPQPKPTQPRPSYPPQSDSETKGSSNTHYFPPQLPAQYDQSQFSTPLKNNPSSSKKPTFDDDYTSLANFYNDVQETKKVNVKTKANKGSSAFTSLTFGRNRNKQRTTAPPNSAENSSEEDDYFFPTPTTTTTKRPRKKKRTRLTSTTPHILDADELRDAFGQSSNYQEVSIAPGRFESKRKIAKNSRNKGVTPVQRATPKNFVLQSAANPPPFRYNKNNYQKQPDRESEEDDQATFETYKISHAAVGQDKDSATSYNSFNSYMRLNPITTSTTTHRPAVKKPTVNNDTDISIISIEKSQSHSYYAGTITEPEITHANNFGFLSRKDNFGELGSVNVVSTGMVVAEDGDFGLRTKRIKTTVSPQFGRVATTVLTADDKIKYVNFYDDADSFYADTDTKRYNRGSEEEDDEEESVNHRY